MNRRRFTRRDANHDAIARAFRSVPGCIVEDCSAVGSRCIPGFPDLLILWRGRIIPVEVKADGGVLTEGESQLHQRWSGCGVRVEVVRTAEDCWRVLGLAAAR
jgi:hypothetical protein